MLMDLSFITGWTGVLLVLIGYYFTVYGEWRAESGRFILLSSCASVLLVVNALLNGAWPFVVVNAAMLGVAVLTVVRKGWPTWQ